MPETTSYNQHMNVLYQHLQLIDVPELVANCKEKWYNQTLTEVNGSVVRLGIVQGEYHWHKHENEDEFFFVLSGKLFIELEDKLLSWSPCKG